MKQLTTITTTFLLLSTLSLSGPGVDNIFITPPEPKETFCLDKLFDAMVQVESSGNPKVIGDNGRALGVLQMHEIFTKEVNRVCGTNYVWLDALCEVKSKEIFITYCNYLLEHKYDGSMSKEEFISRTWNGGPRFHEGKRGENTLAYWEKVKSELNDVII